MSDRVALVHECDEIGWEAGNLDSLSMVPDASANLAEHSVAVSARTETCYGGR